MASHPTFNPNELDRIGATLNSDQNAPLLNRAAQGSYPPGEAITPLITGYAASVGMDTDLDQLFHELGFYSQPRVRMPVTFPNVNASPNNVLISPLQMAVAAATLSNDGIRPAPRIALALETPLQGWIVLPALEESATVLSKEAAHQTAFDLAVPFGGYWEWIGLANSKADDMTWYIAGTLPNWQGAPLSLAVLVETKDTATARRVGEGIMQSVMGN